MAHSELPNALIAVIVNELSTLLLGHRLDTNPVLFTGSLILEDLALWMTAVQFDGGGLVQA